MMSVATELVHRTNSEVIQIIAMSESGSEASKAAKKRLVVFKLLPFVLAGVALILSQGVQPQRPTSLP